MAVEKTTAYIKEIDGLGEYIITFSKNKAGEKHNYLMEINYHPKNYGDIDFTIGEYVDNIDSAIEELERDFSYHIESAKIACEIHLQLDFEGVYESILRKYFKYDDEDIKEALIKSINKEQLNKALETCKITYNTEGDTKDTGTVYFREIDGLGEFMFTFSNNEEKTNNHKYKMSVYYNAKGYGPADHLIGLTTNNIEIEIMQLKNDFSFYTERAKWSCETQLRYDSQGVYEGILRNYFKYTEEKMVKLLKEAENYRNEVWG